MTSLSLLWLPIVVAAVIAFLASAVLHMVLPHHKADHAKVPREDEFRAAVRPFAIPPGDYMVPRADGMAEARGEAFVAKSKEGPNILMTVLPNGEMGMGRSLALWFVYLLVIATAGAYVAGRALPPGADYLEVFRFVGTTAFVGLSGAIWHMTIWYRRQTSTAIKDTIDGLVLAVLMAGAFGWLWPQ